MKTKRLFALARFLILTALLAAAFVLTTPVFAQDEVPPAPEEIPAEVTPVEEPAPVEEAPAEAPTEEPPAEEAAPEIVPLDGNGEALSLATQEAAEALAEPDPWFACTGDIDGICSYAGANALNTALSNYVAMGGSGAIYLEAGTHTVSANVTINGATLANLTGIMADTGESSATVNLDLGTFYLNATNLANGFTLKGMNITGSRNGALMDFDVNTGALNFTDLIVTNTNAGGDGIEITNHSGNVTLHTVKVDENGDQGAVIVLVTGNVSVTNSSFDSNSQGGVSPYNLAIQATGAVSLNGVSASNFNSGNGAVLESQKSITVKNSFFNNNSDGGLMIIDTSKGPVLMDHVYANTNGGTGIEIETQAGGAVTMNTIEALYNSTGVEIDNCWESGGVCTATSAAVTLSNLNVQNPLGNLLVKSNGNIAVAAIKAFYASDAAASFAGIELDNHLATAAKSVTLTDAESRYNLLGGVVINTRGVVTLNHVNASSNYYASASGISITSSGSAAVNILSTLGENITSGNNGNGTYILTNGAVSISKLTASSNIMTNVFIDNDAGTSPVTLNTGNFNYSSTGSGLYVTSRGAITLTNVTTETNANDGIVLSNETAASNQPVTIKPSTAGATTSVGYNGGSALQITSKGAVSVTGLTDHNSSVNGRILINNTFGTGTVSLTNMSANTVNDPSNLAAVAVYSHGAITATDVNSSENLERGMYLDNSTSAGTPGVTIKNLDVSNNDLAGFDILSRGAVKITNADAYSTDGGEAAGKIVTAGSVTMDAIGSDYSYLYYSATNGLLIDAGGAISLKRLEIYNNNPGYGLRIVNGTMVSISDSYFSENSLFGLDVTCSGAITLTNVNTNSNGTYGATLDNSSGASGVTISGSASNYSDFDNNPIHNLNIITHGALKLSYLDIDDSPTAISIPLNVGDVTINHVNLNVPSGASPALDITSAGTVSITTLDSYSASASGVQINNSGATSAKAVTITDFYDTSTAGSYALRVLSKGAITLTNFYVNNSGGVRTTGIYLDNTASTTKSAVSIKTPGPAREYNYAQYFTGNGVEVHSHGQVTLDDMYLRYNNGTGLKVNDALETNLGGVTVTNSYIRYNTNGMNITAGGAIVVSNTRAYGNNGMGVVLDNSGATSVFPVTVTELDAYDNDTGGLTIDSRGTVTITNLDAYSTDISGYGLDIDTDGAVSIGYTSTSWNNLYGNAGSGVLVNAGGNVTIKRLGSYDNLGGFGASITSGGSVSITDGSIYNNATFGLNILANGAITLTNVDGSSNNGSYGAMLDNHLGSGGVTIKGKASDWSGFDNNVTDNIVINTSGAVTMSYINAYNAGTGATITTSGGGVTISDADFDDNNSYGLDITATGTISLTKVDCQENDGTFGARLDNHTGSGGITINGLVSDYSQFDANLGTNIILYTTGAVTMNYVVADGNNISSRAMQFPGTVGNVVINYVEVDNILGAYYGIQLASSGTVSISHVDADYTPGGGILIDNSMASTAKNVTLLDIDANDNSGQYGIEVISKGVISVKDIDLEGNNIRLFGMVLDNSASTTKAGVILGSTSIYNNEITNFVNNGIYILTNGSVTIDKFYIYHTSDGIIVDNTSSGTGTGAVSISNTTVYESVDDGINIATNGIVTLTNVEAEYNGTDGTGMGIYVHVGETATHYSGTVTMTNIETNYNYGDGLYVEAWKNITLKDLESYYNYSNGRGAYLATDGGVSLLSPGGTAWNNLYQNSGSNLVINALGDVTVQKLYAYSSDNGYGLLIDTAGKVTLTTVQTDSNNQDGLQVTAGGSIAASGLFAQYNQLNGADLDNHLGSGGVTVKSSTIYYNYADSPAGGLIINTSGAVLLDKVGADSNDGYGALVTISAPSTASVTVNKSQFSYNGDDGLHIVSQGIVTLNGITANYNYNADTCGVNIDNTAGTGNVTVLATLGANIFHDNNTHGLLINSSGAVIINNTTAYLNSNGVGIGVLNNTGIGSVTITGAVVKDNRLPGIAVTTNGTVTLSNIEAIANGVYSDFSGIDIQTSGDAVLIQNSVISANGKNGIYANLGGAGATLTVKKTFYMGNNRYNPTTDNDENIHLSAGDVLVIVP